MKINFSNNPRLIDSMKPLEVLGGGFRGLIEYTGRLTLFTGKFLSALLSKGFPWSETRLQCEMIGLRSLPIALITLMFIGFVFAFQFAVSLSTFGAINYVGTVTSVAIVRELGPVFTALVVGGRVGAGMAAELGSMRVTEQIDAIQAMGASPYKRLLLPRVAASTLMIPLVSLCATLIGILGSMFVAWVEFSVSPISFYRSTIVAVDLTDFASGFLKPFFFGFGIAIIGCYEGFSCGMGTVGVGKATTRAVVNISIMVVFVDFLLTRIFALLPAV